VSEEAACAGKYQEAFTGKYQKAFAGKYQTSVITLKGLT